MNGSASGVKNPTWYEQARQEAWLKAQSIIATAKHQQVYSAYAANPIGFGEEVIGDKFTDDIKAVMESVRDNPITIAKSATGPGKSHGAARVAIWFYKTFDDAKVYLTAAPPLDNLKKVLWGEVMSVVTRKPEMFVEDNIRALSIARSYQSFITGVAIPTSGTKEQRVAKFSGKHAPHILFIVDEGDAVPDEVYEGIEGCMSGGYSRLLIMFNPKMEQGYVYQLEKEGRANVVTISALTHPNVIHDTEEIPGAVTRGVVLRRINEWTRELYLNEKCNSDCFEVPEFLVGTTTQATNGQPYPPLQPGSRKIIEPGFYYMVMGQYPAQGDQQLISISWINLARSRWDAYVAQHGEIPPIGVQAIMGQDVAEYGSDANVTALRYGGFVPRLKTWAGVDADMTAIMALDYYIEHNCLICFVDATGVGAGVAPNMSRNGRRMRLTKGLNVDVRAFGIKVGSSPSRMITTELGEFYLLRDQLWWAMREWLRTDLGAMLPPDPGLLEELRLAKYKVQNGKIRISTKDEMRASLKRSPDRADALALTFVPMERAKLVRLDI